MQRFRNYSTLFFIIISMAAASLRGQASDTARGGVGYSALMMYFTNSTWDAMPEIRLDYGSDPRDLYYEPLVLQGMEGYVHFSDTWRLGANFQSGRYEVNESLQDTNLMAATVMASTGLTIEYAAPVDYNMTIGFGTTFGLNSYKVEYMKIVKSPDWDAFLDGRNTVMTQNSLLSAPQFFMRLSLSMQLQILDRFQVRLVSGFHFSQLSQSAWTVNGFIPVAAPDDIRLISPYLNASVMLGF